MILACQNINKAFGTNVILKDASFHIEEKEKAAIVGINGAGKSTLLKIIMKQIPADSGEVILAKDRTIGYLAQHEAVSSGNTIYEELLEVKQDIFELERHIRTLELQMKSQSGGLSFPQQIQIRSVDHQYFFDHINRLLFLHKFSAAKTAFPASASP